MHAIESFDIRFICHVQFHVHFLNVDQKHSDYTLDQEKQWNDQQSFDDVLWR